MASLFTETVLNAVELIPYGRVMSYGQIAACAGAPRGARQVGWILNRVAGIREVPWGRVVNNQGRISIKGCIYTPDFMRTLMRAEGIDVQEDLTFNIDEYRYYPSKAELESLGLPNTYISMIESRT